MAHRKILTPGKALARSQQGKENIFLKKMQELKRNQTWERHKY